MASRSLKDLHSKLYPIAFEFVAQCREAGIDVLIYCTWRSPAEQAELFAQGRTKPGRKVTWTLNSPHNHVEDGKPASRAFDCVPMHGGKPAWNDRVAYEQIGKIGEKLGLTWGGRWKVRDMPHFEIKL